MSPRTSTGSKGGNMTVNIDDLNEDKLEQLQGKVIGDVSGAMGLLLSYIGDQLDLYSALSEISPATSEELAASTGLPERYLREWLSANAAGGYVEYEPATSKFSMTRLCRRRKSELYAGVLPGGDVGLHR